MTNPYTNIGLNPAPTGVLMAAFLKTPHGLNDETNWVGGWELGSGALGLVGLWLRQDANGRLVRRMAVKEARPRQWNLADNWVRVGNSNHPREFVTHRMLHSQRASNVVGLHGCRMIFNDQKYRLYLEYCPYNSLGELLEKHRIIVPEPRGTITLRNRMVPGSERGANEIGEHLRGEEGVLPEPFIWMLFEGLAQTALDLQNGRGLPTPYGPWTGEIVHQEIKPDNIFLAEPDDQNFPTYPTPKLGDFDAARHTFVGDPQNPAHYFNDTRTPGHQPPEQNPGSQPLPPNALWQRLAHTNIWQIGQAVRATMLRNVWIGQPDFTDEEPPSTAELRQAPYYYSDQVCNLVDRCLQHDPADRITPRQLMADIQAHLADPILNPEKGMRQYPRRAGRRRHALYISLTDKYRIGMSMQRVPTLSSALVGPRTKPRPV